uniref:NEDD8-activating enzyme E1 catalytic subunit-like isoform X2 n=1 Tax=Styela clava TaxID=7725 RepID=UPI00193A3D11|nr:NEDD8-activating enzyme E1 catalytic subunit-like isoform X2 [Styela clava]
MGNSNQKNSPDILWKSCHKMSEPMEQSDEYDSNTSDYPSRWLHLRKVLERGGPFCHPDFDPCPDTLNFMKANCKILVIGAGGLGCELLKDLAYSGFLNIEVIDMDTIDVSNLNRQFLFREKDVGKPKANVAAEFINKRIPGCVVVPHYCRIEDFDADFYRMFHIVVCGLDSIVARRWINGMFLSLLEFNDQGELDQTTMVPIVDGGTEGFKGNVRVILPGMTPCIECTLDLYPPQVNFPMCTIAHTPRLPEHCIEYVKILLWPQEKPFGLDVQIDGDDPVHIKWIFNKAVERGKDYGIEGVTYRLTQGVIKRIIPAVASTNAVIAAACTLEVLKLASSCCMPLNNYMIFNDAEGIYTYAYEAEKKEDCIVCSLRPQKLKFRKSDKLQDVLDYLKEDSALQMRAPGLTTSVGGKNKTLYMSTVKSIEVATKPNLQKTLDELDIQNGQEIVVADATSPNPLIFKMQYDEK